MPAPSAVRLSGPKAILQPFKEPSKSWHIIMLSGHGNNGDNDIV